MPTLDPLFAITMATGVAFVTLNSFEFGLRTQIGHLAAQFFRTWQLAVWVLVINYIVIPAVVIGFIMLVGSALPTEVKVGFCIAALAAASPFAPLLTRLSRGNVEMAVMLTSVLLVANIIVVSVALPPVAAAVDPQMQVTAWDVTWPILAFLLLPMVLGTLARLRWPDVATDGAHFLRPVGFACLILHVNFYFVAEWSAYVAAWGTGTYLAALAIPFLGIGSAYILASILRLKDAGTRHACEITTGQRNLAVVIVMILFPFGAYPLAGVSALVVICISTVILLIFSLEWRRALAHQGAVGEAAETAGDQQAAVATIPVT